MKKLLLSIVLLLSVFNLQAQNISHIEITKNWYYIYDRTEKRQKPSVALSENYKGSVPRSLS